jgi:hypothetical protein
MGRKGYDRTTKIKAKALWIVGNHSDQQIADQLGIARSKTIGGWRKDEGWDTEREIIQKETERRISEAVGDSTVLMNSRHLKEFQLMQSKGVKALQTLEPVKASDASAMIDAGIKGERLVRGEPTEVQEVRSLMQANVQVLELVVAEVIRALIDAGRMDKRVAKVFADEFAQRVNEAPFRFSVKN